MARRAVSLLTCISTFVLLLCAASSALAVNVTVTLQFRDLAQPPSGPFPDAPLAGWRIQILDLSQQPAVDMNGLVTPLLVTDATGTTPAVQLNPGAYMLDVRPPDPSPYDPKVSWPGPVIGDTAGEGQMNVTASTNFAYTLRLDCGCGGVPNDPCDDCNAGACVGPNGPEDLRPGRPEVCNQIDDDCDLVVDEGMPVPCTNNAPSIIGCADGTREGFMDHPSHPLVAACSGAWTVSGLDGPITCNRQAGNHAVNIPGTGCSAADLCGNGWHVCRGPADFAAHSLDGCDEALDPFYPNFGTGTFGVDADGDPIAPYPGGAFFVARGSLDGATCEDIVSGAPSGVGLFGCGNLGAESSTCGDFDRAAGALCGGLRDVGFTTGDDPASDWAYDISDEWAWACGDQAGQERAALVKRFADRQGGVLCCKDSAPTLPEACDGIDNDVDGRTDEDPVTGLEPGDTCTSGELCGELACRPDGGFACTDLVACDDTNCNGIVGSPGTELEFAL